MVIMVSGCSKTNAPLVSDQINQAFIQDITVLNTALGYITDFSTLKTHTVKSQTGKNVNVFTLLLHNN
jgi:hypothetical protein